MNPPRLGCIADDFTGASDLSSMLVREGLRVVQVFGSSEIDSDAVDADAVVVALKSRSIEACEAVRQSREALRLLLDWGADRIFFKYCSTFDSTPRGNIGPVADALAEELDVSQVWFCPSFPENGRTVYQGHLFVGGQLLGESGMQHHPLNPMTDSNLVRFLSLQTSCAVSLLSRQQIASGARGDVEIPEADRVIMDAICDEDLESIARLACDHKFLTGSSAMARFWARELFGGAQHCHKAAAWSDIVDFGQHVPSVILAGSCSKATREQLARFAASAPILTLSNEKSIDDAVEGAVDWCLRHGDVLAVAIASTDPLGPDRSGAGASSETSLSGYFEEVFALLAVRLVEEGVRVMIVAGGETSGAVLSALKVRQVRIGREIAPGVPWIQVCEPRLSIALKSGNFGGPDFFQKALEVLHERA